MTTTPATPRPSDVPAASSTPATATVADAPQPDAPQPAATDPAPTDPHAGPHGYSPSKDEYLRRLRRVEGQVRGIARMIDEDVYCIDVLTQISAVTKALQAVGIGLVEDHLGHCVVDAARQSPEAGAAKVREASAAIARLVRS